MNTSFFNEMLSSIAEQGRSLLERRRDRSASGRAVGDICEALLSGRGEASGVALAGDVLASYRALSEEARTEFFEELFTRFGTDREEIERLAREIAQNPGDEKLVRRMHMASEPKRQELIRRLNLAPGGTSGLVAMRAELLQRLKDKPELDEVDRDFEHLFSSWFNRGFLVMRRIDWSTPASILSKIIRYEAVHEIRDWEDLRRRIDLADRRLYAFFHPALVDDPLIFVEVALTREIPAAIPPILAEERAEISAEEATTATFYSISNCQKGLRGISFGNFLIKQVVEELRRELPNLKTFVTLSPVPGFRTWLAKDMESEESVARRALSQDQVEAIGNDAFEHDEETRNTIAEPLRALCAHYLVREKRGNSDRPLDPVARFHLGNGARLERVNWFGDPSANGVRQSFGVMVNYLYDLGDIEKNHEAFAAHGTVATSSSVSRLLKAVPDKKKTVVPAA
ncbi:MCD, Malonyl-CoA decarboxylase MCD [Stappia sp. GBMRC 2046]|uniref:MCD, Malonyl-CoA decarboxylase MCD n=1 Tax=Stappia sediminis TaxID=2692190 RepID=A0A7X3LVC6_9HYPH|nr:malonyl-CoA decarboxylase [Stappia sediminis]MXN65816.1 MCD, Malonyl-CoA decarboxylase MCD [Stappia sediminis]